MLLACSVASFGQDDLDLDVQDSSVTVDVYGHYRPRIDSPTGMRRCGVTEASIQARGFTVPVTLTAPVEVSNMQYCNSKTKTVGRTNRLGKRYGNRQIVLAVGVVVWINPNLPGVAVAGGCLNEFNAHIPLPPPTPTPTPVPVSTPTPLPPPPMCANRNLTLAQADAAGLIRVDKGNGVINCELPAPPVAEKEDCPECPKDAKVKPFASTTTRLTGGLMATATSAGVACGVSGLLNKSLKDCLIDAGISAGAGRVVQAVNPSPDSVRVTVNGDTKKFRKGKEGKVGGCELTWEGNEAVLTCDGLECKRVPLYKNFNTTVFAMKRGNKTPVKTQTQSQIPAGGDTIASNNGGLTPGGGVPVLPGNGIPTRPRRNSYSPSVVTNGGNQSNTSSAAQKPACSGQLIKIRGEYRCVTN